MSDRHHIEKILEITPNSSPRTQDTPPHPYQRIYLQGFHRDEYCRQSPPPRVYSRLPPYPFPSVCCSRVSRGYCSGCAQPPYSFEHQSTDGRIDLHCNCGICTGRRERDFSSHRNRSPATKLRLQQSHHPMGSKKHKRHRTAFTPTQLLGLENAFERNHYLVGEERKQLAVFLNLSETQIKVWFQNRRTKNKRQRLQAYEDQMEDDQVPLSDDETEQHHLHHHREVVLHSRQRDISEHEMIEYDRHLVMSRWAPA